MTQHVGELPRTQPAGDHPPPAGPDRSIRRAGLVAGVGLMLMAALGGFGNLVVVEGLLTRGEPATTAGDVLASAGLFRSGVAALYAVVVLDVVVAWALLRVFSPVSPDLSRLAAWFRLAYAGVFLVAISQLAGIPDLLGGDAASTGVTGDDLPAQVMVKVAAFDDIWFAGLILFGIHLALVGFLAYRSGFVPRILGVLLVIAGAGYVFDSFVRAFSPDAPAVSTVTFVGELLLGLWLIARAHRIGGTRS